MLEKIKDLGRKDPLIFHKIGIVGGGVIGVLLGMFISDRADQYEVEVLKEIVTDGPEKN